MSSDDDYLQLAGIQHYAFCPRQWALIHMEQQWQENILTYGGQKLHKNVDNPMFSETRGKLIMARAVPIRSDALRLYGVADMVEFIQDDVYGIGLASRTGRWRPRPVEYKFGQSKISSCDRVQLCAQAMCLEETFDMTLQEGHLFYGRPRRREAVRLDEDLRQETIRLSEEMHKLYAKAKIPPAKENKRCRRCSLDEICTPSLDSRQSVSQYLNRML